MEEPSPVKKRVNVNVEYYVVKHLASFESPSNKSKGARFVSATKNFFWQRRKKYWQLKIPFKKMQGIIRKKITISSDIVWADAWTPPVKEYFLPSFQPVRKIGSFLSVFLIAIKKTQNSFFLQPCGNLH